MTTTATSRRPAKPSVVELRREDFQGEIDGKAVDLFTLTNGRRMTVRLTNYGCKVLQILVPDRNGVIGDVALGYETLAGVRQGQPSMGSFIGRFAGRIAGAKFSLEGRTYLLSKNAGENCLHGGVKGSRSVVFDARQLSSASVEMTYVFRDGEEGFPGCLPLRVVYTVTDDNALAIDYAAVAADKSTILNFTDHTYFNLSGIGGTTILDHVVTVNADRFMAVTDAMLPNGEIFSVDGTPMDFRQPTALGSRIEAAYEQLRRAKGYAHHYLLNKTRDGEFSFAARIADPKSGRVLDVWSTEPAMQLFSGNLLEGVAPRDVGKGGAVYAARTGFCVEPSHLPDAPNQPQFPSTVLKAGSWYTGRIVHWYSVME